MESNDIISALRQLLIDQPSKKPVEIDTIKLNVGGTLFITRKETLLSHKDSLFPAILNGNFKVSRDENGIVFIDRDPILFQFVLSYLRDPFLFDLEVIDLKTREKLVHEFNYYGVDYVKRSYEIPSSIANFNVSVSSRKTWDSIKHLIKMIRCNKNNVFVLARQLYKYDFEGRCTKILVGNLYSTFCVDDEYLCAYNQTTKSINVWNLENDQMKVLKFSHHDEITELVRLDNLNFLYTDISSKAHHLDYNGDKPIVTGILDGTARNQLCLIDDSTTATIGSRNGNLLLWDHGSKTLQTTIKTARAMITRARAMKDYLIVFGRFDTRIFIKDVEAGFILYLTLYEPTFDADIEKDILVTAGSNGIRIWCLSTGDLKTETHFPCPIEYVKIIGDSILVSGPLIMSTVKIHVTL